MSIKLIKNEALENGMESGKTILSFFPLIFLLLCHYRKMERIGRLHKVSQLDLVGGIGFLQCRKLADGRGWGGGSVGEKESLFLMIVIVGGSE